VHHLRDQQVGVGDAFQAAFLSRPDKQPVSLALLDQLSVVIKTAVL
jgi:hypothetical protein